MQFIEILEDNLGKKAIKEYYPLQDGDVISTSASINKIEEWIDYRPNTSLFDGIKQFTKWYINYYQ